MKVSFVVVNPFVSHAPVAPIGAERLVAALLERFPRRVECAISVPFLQRKWRRALVRDLQRFRPDLVGLSLRNLDDALALGEGPAIPPRVVSRSTVPALLETVRCVQSVTAAAILIGGTGFSCAPGALLRATGIRFGVVGPGEEALATLVGRMLEGASAEQALQQMVGHAGVLDAGCDRLERAPTRMFGPVRTPRHPGCAALLRSLDERFPVVFSHGCNRRCFYCIEPSLNGRRVSFRPVEAVVAELEHLAASGLRKVWLCASELNGASEARAVELFREVARRRLSLDLRSYLVPSPVSEALLDAMEAAGQRPWEWNFEFGHFAESVLARRGGPSSLAAQERLVNLFLKRNYPMLGATAVFGGLGESERTLYEAATRLRAYDAALPQGFGLTAAFGVRVYPTAPIGVEVLRDPAPHRAYLYPRRRSLDGLKPLFYSRPLAPWGLAAAIRTACGPMKGGVGIFARPEPAD